MATPVGPVTGVMRVVGSWGGACESLHRLGSHARHYSFRMLEAGRVQIDLRSTTDSYLLLLKGEGPAGAIIAENDNGEPGANLDSEIVAGLVAGTYTVEATTYRAAVGGRFALTIERKAYFTDEPLTPGTAIKAVHVMELRMGIGELRRDLGLPAYGWVDGVIQPGVTAVKAVHLVDLRDALNEVYDAEGRERPRYGEEVRPGGNDSSRTY